MLLWTCVCVLLLQAAALPQEWSETIRENRDFVVPPSHHGPHPVYPPRDEPTYPPQQDSLLSMGERLGVGNAMSMEQIPIFDPMIPGYIPTSTPFDNPSSSLSSPVKALPSVPDCSVRPQTVVEIERMRHSASQIAVMMQSETLVMNKRKAYVEQMTNYLNDRIKELNKVKSELLQETRWLDLSSNRIAELEEKEKLIKLQDIQSCLNDQTSRTTTEGKTTTASLADIATQAASVQKSINAIVARMAAINSASGANGGGSSTA